MHADITASMLGDDEAVEIGRRDAHRLHPDRVVSENASVGFD